ncbi:MAG: chaperonin cofactor prefoldin [Candidatus Woesearchaeota archaeon]|jgi:chaperonin cofactor prefoldin
MSNDPQLQILEQSRQILLSQKHQLQSELLECEAALEQLAGAKSGYKIIGQIMIHKEVAELKNEVASKQTLLQKRLENIASQEESLNTRQKELSEKNNG